MKKILVLCMFLLSFLLILGCSSEEVTDQSGPEILTKIIESGKSQGIKCTDALSNEDLSREVLKSYNTSVKSYSEWLQGESGQKALQDILMKCMMEK